MKRRRKINALITMHWAQSGLLSKHTYSSLLLVIHNFLERLHTSHESLSCNVCQLNVPAQLLCPTVVPALQAHRVVVPDLLPLSPPLACSDHTLSHQWHLHVPRPKAMRSASILKHRFTKPTVLYLLLLSWPFPWWSSQQEFSPLKISAWLFSWSPLLLRRLVCDYNNSVYSPKIFKSICKSLS